MQRRKGKLARAMLELDLTDQALADDVGISRVVVTRGRLEQRNFSLEDAVAIARSKLLEGRISPEDLPIKAKSLRALRQIRQTEREVA